MGKHPSSVAAPPPEAFQDLRSSLRGELQRPGDPGYDDARRIWNGMHDRRPAAIARCLGQADVVQAIRFARAHDLPTAVKGGGHSIAGYSTCDDGLMIDLSAMRSVHIDRRRQTARAEGGALLGDLDAATELHGWGVSAGIISHTGVAGLTLGGGFGWISRKHGLSIDNLLSVELVTAKGEILTASEAENPDLFWGLRGGGGNFGVATSLEFRCADIGREVFSGLIVHRIEKAAEYMRFHRDYVRGLPDEMSLWMVIRHAPPLPFLPEEVHGQLVLITPFVHLGDPEEGKKLLQPVLEFAEPHGVGMGMHPWSGWQSGFDGLVEHFARNYWKSHHLSGLEDACIDQVLEFASRMPSEECEVFIPHMEGAPSRVDASETAFAFRETPFVLNIHTRWREAADDERCIAWAREFFESTRSYAKGVYVNFLSDEGQERVREAYPAETWNRLVELKRRYDPDNFFRMNQNIPPRG